MNDRLGKTLLAWRIRTVAPHVRGRLLDVLRAAPGPVPAAALDLAWPEPRQRARALDSLITDGLIAPRPDGWFALPG